MKTTKDTVNSRILLLKTHLGLGFNEFYQKADISSSTLLGIQNGTEIKKSTAKKIANGLNANLNWILRGEGEMFNAATQTQTEAQNPWRDALVSELKDQVTKKDAMIDKLLALLGGGKVNFPKLLNLPATKVGLRSRAAA